MTSLTYPFTVSPGTSPAMAFQYQYDNMNRLSTMQQTTCTWAASGVCGKWGSASTVAGVTYSALGQITGMTYDAFTETRTYNNLLQLSTETASGSVNLTAKNMKYAYSATQNNGRITQSVDNVTGETVNYLYDALNRLISAQATVGGWGETYSYDGFGNMGTGFSYLTNRPTTQSADANGNSTASGYTWDMENRLLTAAANTWYAYDPHGKRVLTETAGTTCELDFYSIGGKKLGIFPCQYDTNGIFSVQTWAVTYNLYFGKKLIRSKGVTVVTDRLGSVRGTANNEVMRYTPYGTERTTTADGREKWGSYVRDAGTGNDYADQRDKGVGAGAFLSPDRSGILAADPKDPGTWNRYAYVLGDPVNFVDPHGLYACGPSLCPAEPEYPDPDDPLPGPDPGPQHGPAPQQPVGGGTPPPCPTDSTSQMKMKFIGANWSAASAEAQAVQTAVEGATGNSNLTINTVSLATMFLQWSANETLYGRDPQLAAQNNMFGQQHGWTGSIPCPTGNPLISPKTTNACFPTTMTWGQELAGALDFTSSKTGIPYFNALVASLANNPNESSTAMLQSIASNGWNDRTGYATYVTTKIQIQSLITCMGLH